MLTITLNLTPAPAPAPWTLTVEGTMPVRLRDGGPTVSDYRIHSRVPLASDDPAVVARTAAEEVRTTADNLRAMLGPDSILRPCPSEAAVSLTVTPAEPPAVAPARMREARVRIREAREADPGVTLHGTPYPYVGGQHAGSQPAYRPAPGGAPSAADLDAIADAAREAFGS